MSIPTRVDGRGRRIYGAWAGNPKGTPEDQTRCAEEVVDEREMIFHQCGLRRGHGPDGLYCHKHDPAAVESRRKRAAERYERKALEPIAIRGAERDVVDAARSLIACWAASEGSAAIDAKMFRLKDRMASLDVRLGIQGPEKKAM